MSEVADAEGFEGWAFDWYSHGGRFVLEWLPHRDRWVRHFRPGNIDASWSTQQEAELRSLGTALEHPEDRDDARRIAEQHARGGQP